MNVFSKLNAPLNLLLPKQKLETSSPPDPPSEADQDAAAEAARRQEVERTQKRRGAGSTLLAGNDNQPRAESKRKQALGA